MIGAPLLLALGGWPGAAAADRVDASAIARGGVLSGDETLPVTAPFVAVGGRVRPEVEQGDWRLRLPVSLGARETFDASLDEYDGEGGFDLRFRPSSRLRATFGGSVRGRWRPHWPDQYQPAPDGGLLGTDRYSHWIRALGLDATTVPGGRERLELDYDLRIVEYVKDPAFEPVQYPMHLTPQNNVEHSGSLSWRHRGSGFEVGGGADAFHRRYTFVFSRDAGTGWTHAGPGGDPPNPLQRILGIEPWAQVELGTSKDPASVDLRYGLEIEHDAYQGYYSFTGHHPEVELELRPGRRTELEVAAEAHWLRYGPHSYLEASNHPPLVGGDRRYDRRGRLSLGLDWEIDGGLALVGDVSGAIRRTNYPAYEPGVFPATRGYDIDWNYLNWTTSAGFELEL